MGSFWLGISSAKQLVVGASVFWTYPVVIDPIEYYMISSHNPSYLINVDEQGINHTIFRVFEIIGEI
jgi:hypothetical protein